MGKPVAGKCSQEIWFGILISSIFCFLLLRCDYSTSFPGVNNGAILFVNTQIQPIGIPKNKTISEAKQSTTYSCFGRYIYIQGDLPDKFSKDFLDNCKSLTQGSDKHNMCPYLENFGFGPEINNSEGALANESWYSTKQFSLDVIFHNKMKQYECLTNNSTLASAIYIRFMLASRTISICGIPTSLQETLSV
ncbi:putative exostosin [Rosa chinensis]|uniref:Putative exostosin n=1 Tax=Rosa chinensis TaxID=74649 RepID=A0A2P6QW22_ROSCH|nr:putative exostosin [Rosa chinensis]